MSELEAPVVRRGAARRARSYRRSTGILVVGELAVTAGVLIALFLGWKLYYNDAMFANSQTAAANELAEEWANEPVEPEGTSEGDESGVAPVAAQFPDGEAWANIIIPRFGADYRKQVAEGVGHNVLNTARLGIGRYPSTNLPGELGNVVLASHRSAYGGAFHNINSLVVGDHVFLETKQGWYQYSYRNTEYVKASQGEVLASVPHFVNETPTESLLTLTTCNPLYSTAERMIVYTVYDRWWPRAGGPPEEIAGTARAAG